MQKPSKKQEVTITILGKNSEDARTFSTLAHFYEGLEEHGIQPFGRIWHTLNSENGTAIYINITLNSTWRVLDASALIDPVTLPIDTAKIIITPR